MTGGGAPAPIPQTGDDSLRRGTTADLPAVRRIVADAYARYADRMDRPPAPVLNDYLAATEAGQVWVTGVPITGVVVLISDTDGLLIENIAVAPSAQGTGIGRQLMEFAEQQALAHGLPRLTLYTNEVMTENLALYAHLGYREVERRADHGYQRVFMEKVLPGPSGVAQERSASGNFPPGPGGQDGSEA